LQFDDVSKVHVERVWGRPGSQLNAQETKAFEDFVMWRLVELSAKYEMPFQFHTGEARLEGSNAMLLINLIDANPRTKFVLFHGGYPWVGETGAIGVKYPDRVWPDGVWLQTLSYSVAKRAFAEWLEAAPSNHILLGRDEGTGEEIYGATEWMRRCLADVLAEKIEHGELLEGDARHIGNQVFRDNALELYPRLRTKLWQRKA
jgi:predicted TIM-barrel fold metal-dependent hydrolase